MKGGDDSMTTEEKRLADLKKFIRTGEKLGFIKSGDEKKLEEKIKEGIPADKLINNIKKAIGSPIAASQ